MLHLIDKKTLVALLGPVSDLTTPVILGLFALHLLAFFVLVIWARTHRRLLKSAMESYTRGLKHQSVLDATAHISEQIDAFLADVSDVLDGPANSPDREMLRQRIPILDEKRRYFSSMFFDTCFNICRTMIEAYPLLGILGTCLALGVGLAARDMAATAGTSAVSVLVTRLGDAIWGTVTGLLATVVLMFLNSLLEPGFQRLAENRAHVRETVARVKRELLVGVEAKS